MGFLRAERGAAELSSLGHCTLLVPEVTFYFQTYFSMAGFQTNSFCSLSYSHFPQTGSGAQVCREGCGQALLF